MIPNESAIARRSKPLQRVAATEFALAEEILRTAGLLIVPEDQTQRKAFEKLMPHIYVLRNRGCSWAQLAKLLGECGFRLQPSTVRAYFSEMLSERMDICQSRMNEQIAIMAAVRSETAGADLTAISGRVQAQMRRLQQAALSRVDTILGPAPGNSQVPAAPSEATHPSEVGSVKARQKPAEGDLELPPLPVPAESAPASQARSARKAAASPPKAQTSPPEDPGSVVEIQQAKATLPAPVLTSSKRLAALQPGVLPLKRRPNVPDHVYEPGELEHPAIPGLILNRDQRLYGASLEYFDTDGPDVGELKIESPDEKRFRVVWRQMVPMTQTRTADSFTKIDMSLFPPVPRRE